MKLTNIVKTKNEKYVMIDTCYTLDHGFETMVFESDENGNVESWCDLDVDLYSSEHASIIGHENMIKKWKKRIL